MCTFLILWLRQWETGNIRSRLRWQVIDKLICYHFILMCKLLNRLKTQQHFTIHAESIDSEKNLPQDWGNRKVNTSQLRWSRSLASRRWRAWNICRNLSLSRNTQTVVDALEEPQCEKWVLEIPGGPNHGVSSHLCKFQLQKLDWALGFRKLEKFLSSIWQAEDRKIHFEAQQNPVSRGLTPRKDGRTIPDQLGCCESLADLRKEKHSNQVNSR